LCSFGLEVLTVEALGALGGGDLEWRFKAVLNRLARGEIAVQDPARPSSWVNSLTEGERSLVQSAARESLTALAAGRPGAAFAGPSYPGSLTGLGGATLA